MGVSLYCVVKELVAVAVAVAVADVVNRCTQVRTSSSVAWWLRARRGGVVIDSIRKLFCMYHYVEERTFLYSCFVWTRIKKLNKKHRDSQCCGSKITTTTTTTTMTFDQHMSLYIPRVLHSVTKQRMADILMHMQLGVVGRIDVVPVNSTYYAAYVHFDWWFDNVTSRSFQERVRDKEKQAWLTYQEGAGGYWIVLENKSAKHLRYVLATEAAEAARPPVAADPDVFAIEVAPGEEQC